MSNINLYADHEPLSGSHLYDVGVSFVLAVVIVSAIGLMVVLWFSSPAQLTKLIERPLQIGSHHPVRNS